jgi:hypothetical protein
MSPVIITLTKEGFDGSLIKCAPDNIKEGNFRQALEYMLNPAADELNKGYGAIEERVFEILKTDWDKMQKGNFKITPGYISAQDFQYKTATIDDKLNSKPDIYHKRPDVINGVTSALDEIQMGWTADRIGGYKLL